MDSQGVDAMILTGHCQDSDDRQIHDMPRFRQGVSIY